MNRYQRRLYREQSKKAAEGYVPPADCIGQEFTFSAYIYRVVQYHPRKKKFTCELVNALDRRVQVEEAFVRHHCTPPTPCNPNEYPARPAAPRYLSGIDPIISDKTQLGDPVTAECPVGDKMLDTELEIAAVQSNTTLADTSFQTHLVTGDIKNQGEWHRCLVIARELKAKQLWGGVLPLHICGDVTAIHYQLTLHNQLPEITLVGNQWQVSAAPVAAAATDKPLDPAYYLDQSFEWTPEGGKTYTVRVQAWNERRQQFRLYSPGGASWYREPAFVYEHCQPAAAPVIRKPLPEYKIDPRRFWNLMSLSDKRQHIADHVQETGKPMEDPLYTCNCCGQRLHIIGKQVYPAKYNIKDAILVECRNPDCVAYRRTATSESHHEICEAAQCEALKQEQIAYAFDRSQHWKAESNRLYENGKGHTKPALVAERKAQYWLDQLKKLGIPVND